MYLRARARIIRAQKAKQINYQAANKKETAYRWTKLHEMHHSYGFFTAASGKSAVATAIQYHRSTKLLGVGISAANAGGYIHTLLGFYIFEFYFYKGRSCKC